MSTSLTLIKRLFLFKTMIFFTVWVSQSTNIYFFENRKASTMIG